MLASKLDFIANFEDQGDIALIETPEGVSLPYLAKTEGGYLDGIDGQEVAFSPATRFSSRSNPTSWAFPSRRTGRNSAAGCDPSNGWISRKAPSTCNRPSSWRMARIIWSSPWT